MAEENNLDGATNPNPFSYGFAIKLDVTNYEMWSKTFDIFVIGYKKEYIQKNMNLEKIEKYVTWKKDNNILMAWIMNSVKLKIANGLCY